MNRIRAVAGGLLAVFLSACPPARAVAQAPAAPTANVPALLPRESAALAAEARGDALAAADELLALALETAVAAAGELDAARVEAWATAARAWVAGEPDAAFLPRFASLRTTPLATSHPWLADRVTSLMLDIAAEISHAATEPVARDAGLLREFWLTGPFDNERGAGYRSALPPEQGFDAAAEFAGKRHTVRWRRLPPVAPHGLFAFERVVHPHEQTLVYAAVALVADAPVTAALELGGTGAWRAFVNGAEVGSRDVERTLARDQDCVALPLAAGANLLLLKLCHQEGPQFAFTARLRAANGAALGGVRASTEPADMAAAAAARPRDGKAEALQLGARALFDLDHVRGADALRAAWVHAWRFADGDRDRADRRSAERAAEELPDCAHAHWLGAAALATPWKIQADRDENRRRRRLERALAADPRHVPSLVDLGTLLRQASSLWPSARELADRALAAAPGCGDAVLLRQATLHDEGLDAAARLELAAAAAATDAPARVLRAFAARGDTDAAAALAAWDRLIARGSIRVDRTARVRALLRLGRRDAAFAALAEHAAADAFDRDTRLWTARLHLAAGEPAQALEVLEGWLATAPDDVECIVLAGRCAGEQAAVLEGARERQLVWLRRALEVEPNRRDEERHAEYLAQAAGGDAAAFHVPYRIDGPALVAADPGPPADAAAANDPLHWILRQRVVRANGNGTTNDYLNFAVRVLSEDGARQLAHFRLPYYAAEQRARLLACSIFRADGSVQKPNLRGAAVALPNLVPGDVVVIEGRVDDTAASFFGDYFGLVHRFGSPDGSPVRTSELVVVADPGRHYRHQSRNGAPDPVAETIDGGVLRWRWSMRDLPRDRPELARPASRELEPEARITTYRDWDHFASWWWNLIQNQLEVSPAMRATVKTLCADLQTTEQRIDALYRFVTTDVRYEAWEFGVHGYKPYNTAVIHERRHGDCKDKALLLTALLGEIGVQCHPVLIFADQRRSLDDLTLPMVEQFNHCIAWLPPQDGRPGRFLDGTATHHPSDTLPEMDQGARVLVVDRGRAELLDVPWTTPGANGGHETVDVTLRPDGGAELQLVQQPLGNAAVDLRTMLASEPARRREQVERHLVRRFGKAQLSSLQASDALDLAAPVRLEAGAVLPELGQRRGREWQLPSTWAEFDLAQLASEPDRKAPLVLGVPHGDRHTVRYRLPGGWQVAELPADVSLETGFGAFSMQWRREGDQVVVARSFELQRPRIDPAEYDAFRDFVLAVKSADGRLVLLREEK